MSKEAFVLGEGGRVASPPLVYQRKYGLVPGHINDTIRHTVENITSNPGFLEAFSVGRVTKMWLVNVDESALCVYTNMVC